MYYCFNDGRLADSFDAEADAASYVRDHVGYYASELTDAEEDSSRPTGRNGGRTRRNLPSRYARVTLRSDTVYQMPL